MAIEVKLPKLGQTMEEGTIVNCLVKVGDEVKRGDVLFEVETDKATLEMESPAAGFVKQIVAGLGQTLPVGDIMMILGGKDEKVDVTSLPAGTAELSAVNILSIAVGEVATPAPAATTSNVAAKVEAPAGVNVIKLAKLGQTMEEGTIVNCLVKVGDEVKRGDVLFEIETDKATLEMESPSAGFVKYIVAQIGQTLPVGDSLMILAPKDTQIPQNFIDSLKGGSTVTEPTPSAAPTVQAAKPMAVQTKATGRIMASPRAKKAAKNMGIDLASIVGTGPMGRITEKDVKTGQVRPAAKSAPAVASGDVKLGSTIAVNRLQKITAQRMLQSKLEIPCFYLSVKVDVTDLVDFRTKFNEANKVKVAYNDFIILRGRDWFGTFPHYDRPTQRRYNQARGQYQYRPGDFGS